MLKIYFGDMEKVTVRNVDLAFNLHFKADWFQHPLVQEIMRDIDDIVEVNGTCLKSWRMSVTISPQQLSGGTKSLILMIMTNTPNKVFYSGRMGENCYKYVHRIAKDTDINLVVCSEIPFEDEDKAYIYDTDKYIIGQREFLIEYIDATIRYEQSLPEEDYDD